jgi:hypothetical protein
MPPFQYEPYHNPYVQSMSALIQAQGQAQAEGALRSGQVWGNAIQGIGQEVAQIPQQIQAQKMKALQMQDIQGQIAERQSLAAERQQTLAAAQAGSAAIKGSIDPATGQVNHEKAAAAWEAAGFPTQANAYRESVQKTAQTAQALTEGQQKIAAGQQQVQQASANHLGELGAAGIQKLDAGATPIQARDYTLGLIANAASHGLIKEDQANQMVMQAAQAGPDQLRAVYQKMLDAAPTVKTRLVEEELKKAETAKNLAEAGKASAPQTKNLDEFQTFKASYPKTLGKADWDSLSADQQTKALGVYAESKADPAVRAAALAQKNLSESLAQAQLNQMPTPEQAKSVADDLVHHRLAPEQMASLFSTRGKEGLAFKLAVTSEAKKMDPGFNFEQASAEYVLSKSPNFQNTVRYMDAAVESIPRLDATAKKLGNGQFKSVNDLVNAAKNQFNDTDLKAFKTDALLVGDEIAKILQGGGTGSGVSDAKLKQASDIFSTADSVPAIAAAIKEVQFLIGNRRQSLTRGTYMERAETPAGGSSPKAGGFEITRTPVR